MYSEDFHCGAKDKDVEDSCNGEDKVTGRKTNRKKKWLSKGAKPREISKEDSLYRLIITYFLKELCPTVSQLCPNPLAVKLGNAGFFHEPIYNKLASVYKDSTHESLKSFVFDHDIYVTSSVQKEAPATFDELSALALSQGMEFINKHNHQAKRWQVQSGNQMLFDAYCANQPHLLLYSITEKIN
jgi:hypothetical protein